MAHQRSPVHTTLSNRGAQLAIRVDPKLLLRMIIAKQQRSEKLLETARRFAELVGQRRERVLLYEAMQADMEGEMRALFRFMGVDFSTTAHREVAEGSLLKHATEDLSRAIANWDEVLAEFAKYPCLLQMLHDRERRIFDDCGEGLHGGPCDCTWRTPIEPQYDVRAEGASRENAGHQETAPALWPTGRLTLCWERTVQGVGGEVSGHLRVGDSSDARCMVLPVAATLALIGALGAVMLYRMWHWQRIAWCAYPPPYRHDK